MPTLFPVIKLCVPTGRNRAPQANGDVLWFCTLVCRAGFVNAGHVKGPFVGDHDSKVPHGTVCAACGEPLHDSPTTEPDRTPDLRLDAYLVEHGYQIDLFVDGKLLPGSGCRDFGRDHDVKQMTTALVGHIHAAIAAWYDQIDKPKGD